MEEVEIIDLKNPKISQGCKKLWNYFLDLAKSNSFQKEVLKIRKKYKIPEKGFAEKELLKIYEKETDDYEEMFVEIIDVCNKFGLAFEDWYLIIENYILSNEIDSGFGENSQNVCVVGDLIEDETKRDKECNCISCKNRKRIYPIAIKISPYASERDIIDYVKKNFSLIRSFQKKYENTKIKIGKIKKKNPAVQERNNFIYQNRSLSLNETKRLVEEKFGESLDYEYIGKIRSMEAKRRKNV